MVQVKDDQFCDNGGLFLVVFDALLAPVGIGLHDQVFCLVSLLRCQLLAHGFSVHSSTSSSFVYVLTATHAVHLGGGILVLLYAGIISLLHRAVETRRIVLEIAGWYWHFMGVLWIYIFALLQFGR